MARRSFGSVVKVAGMVLALSAPPSLAGVARAATMPSASAAEAQEAATVEGYRSALFGMSESEARKTIEKDFQGKNDQVKRSIHPIDKTSNLVGTANILRRYLAARGYLQNKVTTNRMEDGSVIVFQGADAEDRTVLLRLMVPAEAGKITPNSETGDLTYAENTGAANESPPAAQSPWLRLWYMKNATVPDIFKVKKGQF